MFLSCDEFEALLVHQLNPPNLTDDFKKEIRQWSAGHIGAIEYLLTSICIRSKVRFLCSELGMLPKVIC